MAKMLPEDGVSSNVEAPQPGSPDVLEEALEKMLEHDSLEQPGSPDVLEEEAEPNSLLNGAKGASDDLDPDVADALEAELFGGTDDTKEGAAPQEGAESPDVSETELFGPEDDSAAAKSSSAAAANATVGKENYADNDQAQARDLPDAATAAEREAQREAEEGPYDQKNSRYMRDQHGNLLHKWKADYAARGGAGRAQCRDTDCLERHDQGGCRSIEKGCLRIGRRVLMDKDNDETGGNIVIMWFHARCIFNTFLRARKSTRNILSELDIEGFDQLLHEDKEMLRKIIDGNESLRNVRFRSFDGVPTITPQKRGADGGGDDPLGANTGAKRKRKGEDRTISKGDRVWTHFRCLPRDAGAVPGGAGIAVKSAKPELATIKEESTNGSVIVQFESVEHEKERIELYQSKKGKRIRGWLRYPRVFEGKLQRVPLTWMKMDRNPPPLCGCKQQQWGHECECGISCGRGYSVKVFGVGSNAA